MIHVEKKNCTVEWIKTKSSPVSLLELLRTTAKFVKIEHGRESHLSCKKVTSVFSFVFQGGDQSPESSAEWTPGRSPEATAVSSVCRCQSRFAACQHSFLNHYLLFLFPVTALRVAHGLPW